MSSVQKIKEEEQRAQGRAAIRPNKPKKGKEGTGRTKSKGHMQNRRRQKEKGKKQGREKESKKPEAITRAQGYVVKEGGPTGKRSAHDGNAHSKITYTSRGREGWMTKPAPPNRHRALEARLGDGESHQSKNIQRTEATQQRESNRKKTPGRVPQHQGIRATPDKSSYLREEMRANGNKGKRLEPGEADKQPSHDIRNERDRVVMHPPPNQ